MSLWKSNQYTVSFGGDVNESFITKIFICNTNKEAINKVMMNVNVE